MARPKREHQQTDLRQRIKTAAWEQIAVESASALALRAIARKVGITAPAIYHYFADRDALVTALIIEAYTSLGDSQLAARDAVPAEDLGGRLLATGVAYRAWALMHPQHYQLIFGTPIPGYVAPFEQVFPSASRSFWALVSVVEAIRQAGRLRAEGFPEAAPDHEPAFSVWQSYAGGTADTLSVSVATLIWARVHGLVSLEIAGSIPPFGASGDALYRYELAQVEQQFISQ